MPRLIAKQESPADIAARYPEGREGYLRASFAEVLSVALFVVFLAAFSALLRRAEGDTAPLAAVAVVAGSVAAALEIVAYTSIAASRCGSTLLGSRVE